MSIDTSKLNRYKPGYVHSNDGPGYISMLAREDGEYVRLEDVIAITIALEQALTQQRGECEDAHKFRRLAQLLDGFDFRLGRNALMPPATYLDSVEITCEFQPGIGQSVIDAIVDVLTTEKLLS